MKNKSFFKYLFVISFKLSFALEANYSIFCYKKIFSFFLIAATVSVYLKVYIRSRFKLNLYVF